MPGATPRLARTPKETLQLRRARFDSIINSYLIAHCNLDPPTSPQYGLAVHAHTDYYAPIAYPAVAELALRVNKLGRSSVTYEVAVFERGVDAVRAVGEFVHVFVDRATGRPAQSGMGDFLRQGLEKLRVDVVDQDEARVDNSVGTKKTPSRPAKL
ncbi:hypothetical protein G7Z17_g12697 [Cylindrodendrum hubeiense]|uniref:Thioesterase domain-containing protein n=1 Tax=Cylindrodendrum hubeiense TaxID=595255 RepID=A0A9P5L595_9HYPO|nr:hypothetical protein G7Z17_g12697 [Cylindrodendrum hubeiense]